jgi:BirA family biotin operon repressor/biotin-[acetyl-CoA-carboxylase] ligase
MSRLDAAGIRQPLDEITAAALEELEVFPSIASTNTYLMAQPSPPVGRLRVAVADHQTAGRGRHERRWLSAPGAGLCMSVAYTFERSTTEIDGLTLAIGVGAVRALRQLDIDDVSLKWPNDIVAQEGKLGGILTEAQAGRSGNATVVTGIGINVNIGQRLDLGAASDWAQRPVDLQSLVDRPPPRDLLAGKLLEQLYLAFRRFDEVGVAGFMDAWRRHDWLLGREIAVDMPDRQVTGIAAGVDDRGLLLVDTKSGQVSVIAGSIAMASREGGTA